MNITIADLINSYASSYRSDIISILDMKGNQLYVGSINNVPHKYTNCRIARFNGTADNIREFNYVDVLVGKVRTYLFNVKLVVTLC